MEEACRVCLANNTVVTNTFESLEQFIGYVVERCTLQPEHICPPCLDDALRASDLLEETAEQSRTQPRERPYQCSQCSSAFYRKCDLNVHTRVHTGERPYMCEHCSRRFARSDALYEHIRKHTGERPFQCTRCSKSFSHRRSFRQHMKIHTADNP